jgi:protocatechuate 3,4-dioxygenase beta subunit
MLSGALASGQPPAPAASSARVSGRILDAASNAALAGARVVLVPLEVRTPQPGLRAQMDTDRDGHYIFQNLAPGIYGIQVTHAGFAPLIDFSNSRTFALVAGQALDHLNIALTRSGAVAGRILDPTGSPIAGAEVRVMRRSKRPGVEPHLLSIPGVGQRTDDRGEFRFDGVAAGTYYVTAESRPLAMVGAERIAAASVDGAATTLAPTFYPGTRDEEAAQVITVTAGETVANISFAMQSVPAFLVSGIVVDDSGNPVSGAVVMLGGDTVHSGMLYGTVVEARTAENGRFVFANVAPGSYQLTASVAIVNRAGGGAVAWATSSDGIGPGGIVGRVEARAGGSVFDPHPREPYVVDNADLDGLRIIIHR